MLSRYLKSPVSIFNAYIKQRMEYFVYSADLVRAFEVAIEVLNENK